MAPYHPPSGGRSDKLRLDFNENTVGASPAVIEALQQAIQAPALTIYPEYARAMEVLSGFFGVDQEEMILTNGTDEAIAALVNTFVDDGEEALILTPSYAMYKFYAELAGADIVTVPYREGSLAFPLSELLDRIHPLTKAIFISNPNNPTGTAVSLEGIERLLKRAPHAAVLIDEAYYEFCGVTAIRHLKQYPNLFVSRTFSKVYGMAAMRVGCLFSNAENMKSVKKCHSPYSVNTLAVVAATAAVQDTAYITGYVTEVLAARELMYVGLEKLTLSLIHI